LFSTFDERMDNPSIAIRAEHLTQRFRVIHERPDTVRELFAKFLRKPVNYHDFEAVSDASFTIGKGEMVGLIGRNGSGKSTLLKIIAGVYRPTGGSIHVEGTVAPLIELGAGMHPELTGRENIVLNGLLMGYSKKEMSAREKSVIEFADIGDFINAPVKQYSSGMYLRLAFAVATEVDPDVLLLDEILAVGDFAFQQKCYQRLERFRAAGKTILLVTHSVDQLQKFCDRGILLDKGKIIYNGDPGRAVSLYLDESSIEEPVLVDAPSLHA
jgi:ABC-type polysaccharide/polyol phosphate transport system ATPase subunit